MAIITWILQLLLGVAFIMAGFGKLAGSKTHRDAFTHWKLPQWFRLLTGVIEVVAGGLLLIGFFQKDFAFYGALLIVVIGAGGVLTHVRVGDSVKDTIPIALLALFGLIFVFLL